MKRARQRGVVDSEAPQTSQESKKQKTCSYGSVFGECDLHSSMDWGNLPHHVILRVFQFLPLVDRARASSVCRRWNEVFHIPDLWRRFEFELSQPATSYLKSTHPDLIQQIIKRHADHLQYVSFKVSLGWAEACLVTLLSVIYAVSLCQLAQVSYLGSFMFKNAATATFLQMHVVSFHFLHSNVYKVKEELMSSDRVLKIEWCVFSIYRIRSFCESVLVAVSVRSRLWCR